MFLNSEPLIFWIFALPRPSGVIVSRIDCSLAGWLSSATRRVPDVKSIPRFRPFPPIARAPISRINPDAAKKYFDFPMKSQWKRWRVDCAPSADLLLMSRERPTVPSTACVSSTAVRNETSVPTPSVNANPLTPAVARMKRMNATMNVTTFASTIAVRPFL